MGIFSRDSFCKGIFPRWSTVKLTVNVVFQDDFLPSNHENGKKTPVNFVHTRTLGSSEHHRLKSVGCESRLLTYESDINVDILVSPPRNMSPVPVPGNYFSNPLSISLSQWLSQVTASAPQKHKKKNTAGWKSVRASRINTFCQTILDIIM